MSEQQEFFDESFRTELEQLAGLPTRPQTETGAISLTLNQKLASFLDLPDTRQPMSEDDFVSLSSGELTERTNVLLELCRGSQKAEAMEAVDNFIVFFRALIPTLCEEGSGEIRRVFFRLVPSLLQIAYRDFAKDAAQRDEGRTVLRKLETILIEISHVRLAPAESELVFRSIDQLTGLFNVGEYAMANDLIASQLLSIIGRNDLMRSLYRIMEIEASIESHIKERLGHSSPRIHVPEDLDALAEYGPLHVFHEEGPDSQVRSFLQVQLPNIAVPQNVVLHLLAEDTRQSHELRLDALGTAPLTIPPGEYRLGLAYQPPK